MALIILFPALLCWLALAMGGARKALLDVYLPVVLLLPGYYILRVPHTPPITFSDAAMLPLGIAIVMTAAQRWRFHWMDLWVLLYAVSAGLSEGLSTELANGEWVRLFTANSNTSSTLSTNIADGILQFIARVSSMILPYMAGKLLIEQVNGEGQSMRKKLVGRMVSLLAIVALISVYDFLTGKSLWQSVGSRVFPNQYVDWPPQMRWGFGRIAGPYAHAILAGMVFLMGMAYCLWLRRVYPDWCRSRLISGIPLTIRGLILGAIVGGLLMTQSRGPWAGVLLSVVFAFLMRSLSVGKAAVVFLAILGVFAMVTYYYGKQYTEEEATGSPTTEEHQSAIYRRQLLDNYIPVVMDRKAFGWGITTFPKVKGQTSIDNHYLLLAVTQGFFGLGLFLAILASCAGRLLWLVARPARPEDQALVFAHLAVLIGLTVALATVYMGEQVVVLFFLFIGWVQGMRPAPAGGAAMGMFPGRFEFHRVLT